MIYYSLVEDEDGYSHINRVSDSLEDFEDTELVFIKESLPIVSGDFGIDLKAHVPFRGRFDAAQYIIYEGTLEEDDPWMTDINSEEETQQYRVQIWDNGKLIKDFYE